MSTYRRPRYKEKKKVWRPKPEPIEPCKDCGVPKAINVYCITEDCSYNYDSPESKEFRKRMGF